MRTQNISQQVPLAYFACAFNKGLNSYEISTVLCHDINHIYGSRGGTGGQDPSPPPPGKSQTIGFLSNAGPKPQENHNRASIQCWVIAGPPVKHHLNGVSLVGR